MACGRRKGPDQWLFPSERGNDERTPPEQKQPPGKSPNSKLLPLVCPPDVRCRKCHVSALSVFASTVVENTDDELLSVFRKKYTTAKKLVVSPVSGCASSHESNEDDRGGDGWHVLVEVLFTGPQPCEGPGSFLCDLLRGGSVKARPVELERGRKKKTKTTNTLSESTSAFAFRGKCFAK